MLYKAKNFDLSKLLADSIYAYAVDNGLIPIAISCEANQLLSWLDESLIDYITPYGGSWSYEGYETFSFSKLQRVKFIEIELKSYLLNSYKLYFQSSSDKAIKILVENAKKESICLLIKL